jgi:SAM-dependent methyltransferase
MPERDVLTFLSHRPSMREQLGRGRRLLDDTARRIRTKRSVDGPRPARLGEPAARAPGSPSSALLSHVEELPLVRRSILETVRNYAAGIPRGARVLDAGAGDAPYAELFGHCEYVTADWPNSMHSGGRRADIVASLENLPVADESFGAVLCTEVLEHIARPDSVLAELHRVLAPGGRLCLTVPFVWPLHEEPFDFYRYTADALAGLLAAAGFVDVLVKPRTGYLTTLGQVAALAGALHPRQATGFRALQLRVYRHVLRAYARPFIWLATRTPGLDDELTGVPLPLGYAALATNLDPREG